MSYLVLILLDPTIGIPPKNEAITHAHTHAHTHTHSTQNTAYKKGICKTTYLAGLPQLFHRFGLKHSRMPVGWLRAVDRSHPALGLGLGLGFVDLFASPK